MDTSEFNSKTICNNMEHISTNGSTCDTFRTKMYGKQLFVKRLKPQYASDIRYREALKKEFEVGFTMEHKNLARYISFNGDEIYMEYIDGETLTEKLANDKEYFSKRKNSDKLIKQLLSAVEYLHSNQTLHLDIKPDNIMLTRINNDVKLIDLGFCYTDCFADTTGYTPQYCSPEQQEGKDTDERSDIYTIGRIIELLPNRHIYKKIITRCTATNKAHRYQSIKEIILPKKNITKWGITLSIILATIMLSLCLWNISSAIKISQKVEYNINSGKQYQENIEKEFVVFKSKTEEYFKDVICFVNDENNTKLFPSYMAYGIEFKRLWKEAVRNIEKDNWFYSRYNGAINPFSSYIRNFHDNILRKYQMNADKLP